MEELKHYIDEYIYYIFIVIIIIVIIYISQKKVSYKDKLSYLDTRELQDLCNSTKDEDNNIMVMMFTHGHIDEARNCIYSYKKSTEKHNILVFALDKETKESMDKDGIACYYAILFYNDSVKDSEYMTKQFDIICYNKLLIIYASLLQGINVLWSDTDIVYFKDPFKKLHTIQKPISIQNNTNQDNINNNLCAGFMFFKNTEHSKVFLHKCIEHINNDYERLIVSKSDADQGIINKFNDPNIINVLSVEEFPNGLVWWGKDTIKPLDYNTYNNNIKMNKIKESELWFIK